MTNPLLKPLQDAVEALKVTRDVFNYGMQDIQRTMISKAITAAEEAIKKEGT